jgi:AraC family transcriptional regulator
MPMETGVNTLPVRGQPYPISSGTVVIEAASRFPAAAVQVSHLDLVRRRQHVVKTEGAYRIDLCTTQRHASKMRFERWAANRFERPGRLFVVPPGETLTVWNDLGRETVVVCHLYTEMMSRCLEQSFERDLLDSCADVADDAIGHLMLRMREEVCHPGFASEVMIEGLALQLGVALQRHYRTAAPLASRRGLTSWRLRRIDDRLRSSAEPASLAELATLCGLSVRQLSRGFRASHGISIGQFIARLRIDKAKQELVSGRSIKVLAAQLGFCSTAAFSSAFRKATGLTPTEFRRLASLRH